jgi:hypothetical protein
MPAEQRREEGQVMAEKPVADGGESDKARLDVLLAEFKALRDEIGSRATSSHTLMNMNVVASGVLGGLVVNNPGRVELLLLLPILSPILGLLWLDHAHNIRNIGDYIGTTLRPAVNAAAGDTAGSLLGWEDYVDRYEQRALLRFLPLGVPVIVLFAGIPLASLIRTTVDLETAWQWATWAVGVLLTASFVLLWLRLLRLPFLIRSGNGP